MFNRRCFLISAPGMLALTRSAFAEGDKPVSPVVEAYRRTYQVTMTTRVRIPSDRKVTRLRIWHALPTKRSWSETDEEHGATAVTFTPESASMEQNVRLGAHYIHWENTEVSDGQLIEVRSSYKVRSAKRTPDHKQLATVKWATPAADWKPDASAAAFPEDVARLIARSRACETPAEAVMALCEWIDKNMYYDANVPYSPFDFRAALATRKGHCGHFQILLREFCAHIQIAARSVTGMNLISPNPLRAPLYKVRKDYANIHTWGEVYFPGVGWLEVEPGRTEGAFNIPANWIHNNRMFQCYSVWANENGREIVPQWRQVGDHHENDYQIENLISYVES